MTAKNLLAPVHYIVATIAIFELFAASVSFPTGSRLMLMGSASGSAAMPGIYAVDAPRGTGCPLRCWRRGRLRFWHHPELGQNRGEVPVLAVPLDQSVVSQFEDRSHAHVDLLPRAWWQWAELPAVGPGEIPLHDGHGCLRQRRSPVSP